MQQQTDKAAEQLLRDVRARPQIGFNLNNGHLSFVNVTFASVDVSDRNIAELESLVRQALKKTLVEQPQQIVVSVQSAGGPQ